MKKTKALLLFSGGLDSILAAKILQEQKIKLVLLFFKSYFFYSSLAKKSAKILKLKLKVVNFAKEHLEIIKKPIFGYGVSMNPCLDCHLLMLKKAKEIMLKEKFDFVATGEVLGERPFSQNFKALKIIEEKSDLQGYLLRPLSAKLLPPTLIEKKGLIDRGKLLALAGRQRKKQLELAKKFKIRAFPSPAGGCLLTDLAFGKRLKELLKIFPHCQANDIEILKIGRHFWQKQTKIVVGRHHQENLKLKKLAKKGDILLEMLNYPGPTTLIRNYHQKKINQSTLEKAKKLTQFYSTKSRNQKDVKFKIFSKIKS